MEQLNNCIFFIKKIYNFNEYINNLTKNLLIEYIILLILIYTNYYIFIIYYYLKFIYIILTSYKLYKFISNYVKSEKSIIKNFQRKLNYNLIILNILQFLLIYSNKVIYLIIIHYCIMSYDFYYQIKAVYYIIKLKKSNFR